MADLPNIAVIHSVVADCYLVLSERNGRWINVRNGVDYGPDLPADAQRYVPELTLASVEGQLADVVRDNRELFAELRRMLRIGERLGAKRGTSEYAAGLAQAYYDATEALRGLLDRDVNRGTQDQTTVRI